MIGEIIKKIQNQPVYVRKIILWAIVVILSLTLLTFWVKNARQRLKSFPSEELRKQFQFPAFEGPEEMPKIEIPKLETPEISEEELRELEKMMEQAQ